MTLVTFEPSFPVYWFVQLSNGTLPTMRLTEDVQQTSFDSSTVNYQIMINKHQYYALSVFKNKYKMFYDQFLSKLYGFLCVCLLFFGVGVGVFLGGGVPVVKSCILLYPKMVKQSIYNRRVKDKKNNRWYIIVTCSV